MELLAVTVSGVVVSVLTSLFKTANLTKGQRSILALALSVAGGLVTVLASTDLNGVVDITKMAVATFAASQVVYTGVLKNTSMNGKLEEMHVFTSANQAKVEEVAKMAEKTVPKKTAKKATPKKTTTK
jgi:uncharacterized membrane protein